MELPPPQNKNMTQITRITKTSTITLNEETSLTLTTETPIQSLTQTSALQELSTEQNTISTRHTMDDTHTGNEYRDTISQSENTRKGKKKTQRGWRKKLSLDIKEKDVIINLSDTKKSDAQIRVLNKGLKFAPTPKVSKFEAYIGVEKFIRKICLKKYFLKNPILEQEEKPHKYVHTELKETSKKFPR